MWSTLFGSGTMGSILAATYPVGFAATFIGYSTGSGVGCDFNASGLPSRLRFNPGLSVYLQASLLSNVVRVELATTQLVDDDYSNSLPEGRESLESAAIPFFLHGHPMQ